MTPVADRTFTPSAPFECHWQCSECGFQVPPRPPRASPDSYRAPAEVGPQDRRPEGPCAGCGKAGTWANLREGAVVEALIELDAARDSTRFAPRGLLAIACVLAWVLVGGFAIGGFAIWYLLPLALGATWMAARDGAARSRMPSSWSHQHFPGGGVQTSEVGVASGDWQLRAPLTGRPCLAYELGVRHDDDSDDEAWTWTLLEQRCARGVRVGDAAVQQNPHLLVARQRCGALGPRGQHELRKRGIDPTRPGYVVYETVIELGDRVELQTRRGGLILSTRGV